MTQDHGTFVGDPPRTRWHRAWTVAVVTLGALVAAAAFRSSTGVLLEPIETEFGWSRAVTSGAVSLNLVLYGLIAPFAAAFMERFGVRRTVATALVVVGVASGLTVFMTQPWQLWLLWGVFIGIGTGAMALVFGAIVANRWFHTHRGLVTGIFSAANATGQLLFLPLVARTAVADGWRAAAGIVAVLALLMAGLVVAFLRDRPSDHGLLPYGLEPGSVVVEAELTGASPARWPSTCSARPAAAGRSGRWSSPSGCAGGRPTASSRPTSCRPRTTTGCRRRPPPACSRSSASSTSWGTVASGWLTDRVDPRRLLVAYYGGRGVSLLALDAVLAPGIEPGMWVFIVFYGLDWVATVPPTVALCRSHFGLADSGVVFGWVFAAHMVGAGVGASVAGWVRTSQGDYHWAWVVAAALCFASVAITLSIPRLREPAVPAVPAGSSSPQ